MGRVGAAGAKKVRQRPRGEHRGTIATIAWYERIAGSYPNSTPSRTPATTVRHPHNGPDCHVRRRPPPRLFGIAVSDQWATTATATRCVHDRGTTSTTASATNATHQPVGVLVRQVVTGDLHGPLRVEQDGQMSERILEVGVGTVLSDQHLRPKLGDKLRHHGVERPPPTPRPRFPAGSATLTAEPSAEEPVSSGHPVCGNSVRGCSCSEIVRTRGSSQNAVCTPSP